ncbi:hypothetical protein MXB_5689 [Myxobolus squamalis]|nr:hypothetical protein MXB_5689 [Myxobolus squamalis]
MHENTRAIIKSINTEADKAINRNLPFLENLKLKLIEYLDKENIKNDELNQPELVHHIEETTLALEQNPQSTSQVSLVTNDINERSKFEPETINHQVSDSTTSYHNSYFDRNRKPATLIRDSNAVEDGKSSDSSLISISRPKIDRQSKRLIKYNIEDHYMITHLLIPKQTGSADSCCCDNEEDLFTYQVANDLITLGWIHVLYRFFTLIIRLIRLKAVLCQV